MKIEQIKAKVLETGKISPLINYTVRKGRGSVEIVTEDIDYLYKQLLEGAEFNILQKNSLFEILNESGEPINERLEKLYDQFKEISIERGINALYIACGMLKWNDTDGSQINSPLLLIPVELVQNRRLKNGEFDYKLKIHEEKATINISLVQKLREEKVELKLPDFTNEMTIKDYLLTVNEEAMKNGFVVTRTYVLGIFYSPRMNIYRDLTENEDKVVNHPIVLAINGDQSKIPPLDHKNLNKTDCEMSYLNHFAVVSCDGSQLRAINETAKGKSLVIQGPPGTGKSQTITNIIATALANNKKVLFVAEKKAALDVVYKNLKRANLDDFCLYLDSNKISRKTVFKNLHDTLIKNKTVLKKEAIEKLLTLDELKNYFDKYDDELHEEIAGLGISMYQLLANYVKYMNSVYVEARHAYIGDRVKTLKEYEDGVLFIDRYNDYLSELGINYYKDHIFYGYKYDNLTLQAKERVLYLIKKLLELPENEIIAQMDFSLIDIYNRLHLICDRPEYMNVSWLDLNKIRFYKSTLSEYFANMAKHAEYKKELEEVFTNEALKQVTAKSLHVLPNVVTNDVLKANSKDIKANTKILKKILLNKKTKLTKENVVAYTNLIKSYAKVDLYLEANKEIYKKFTNSDNVDINQLFDEICLVEGLLSDMDVIPASLEELNVGPNAIGEFKVAYELIKNYFVLLDELNTYYDLSIMDFRKLTLPKLKQKLSKAASQIDSLNTFISLARDMKANSDLIPFIDEAYEREINRFELSDVYSKVYYGALIDREIKKYHLLEDYSLVEHASNKAQYTELDEVYNLIAMARVREHASDIRPIHTNQSTKSDVGILKTQKEKPTMYIKELFQAISRSLLRIKPVMLMSPLTVSTYLPSDLEFDMVIFDEASQIQPEDAICSIYRSKQIVVVGDSEQLPPTDFFKKLNHYENFDEMEDDDVALSGDSLLSLCNTFLESVSLKWHYRSRNEELITFSNQYIYHNELVTFPAPRFNCEDEGVEFYPTYNGIYGRGTTRTNVIEAEKVADLIIEHIDKYPERSLGVISFSVAQKNEINRSLNKRLVEMKKNDRERYEKMCNFLFTEDRDDPFFIKNLENVQGDERDTIIFSICYGKDHEDGELFYNLGKLTRDEGRKRINVAVSRSKINMKVVCSFDPTLIKISNSEQTGLLAMKQFLVYAKDKTLEGEKAKNEELIKDELANDIKFILEQKGYKVSLQLGKSQIKLDLAIHNPENEDEFILGIMLDGENYRRCKTVRDREKLRELVLARLGWNICHIWITDYVKNRSNAIKQILEAIGNSRKIKKPIEYTLGNFEEEVEHKEISFSSMYPLTYDEAMKAISKDLPYNTQFKELVIKMVNANGPIHLLDLTNMIKEFFGAKSLNEQLPLMVRAKIEDQGLLNDLVCDKNFYYSKNKNVFPFRIDDTKREMSTIYKKELADLLYKIVAYSSGISKDLLILEAARYCLYGNDKLSLTDIECFNNAYKYLLDNEKIIIVNGLAYV